MRKWLVAMAVVSFLLTPGATSIAAPPQEAIIHINSEVGEELASKVADEVTGAVDAKAKHLTILINTPGGSFAAGMDMIQSITDSGIPTTCIVGTEASSMGAVILESSACGKRVVHAHSLVMIHGAANKIEGKYREIQNDLIRMHSVNLSVANIICARTGWPFEKYWHDIVEEGREIWLVGEEVVNWNLADKVIPVPKPTR